MVATETRQPRLTCVGNTAGPATTPFTRCRHRLAARRLLALGSASTRSAWPSTSAIAHLKVRPATDGSQPMPPATASTTCQVSRGIGPARATDPIIWSGGIGQSDALRSDIQFGRTRRARYHQPLLVVVAQLVRAPRCGRGCRGFESPRSPQASAGRLSRWLADHVFLALESR